MRSSKQSARDFQNGRARSLARWMFKKCNIFSISAHHRQLVCPAPGTSGLAATVERHTVTEGRQSCNSGRGPMAGAARRRRPDAKWAMHGHQMYPAASGPGPAAADAAAQPASAASVLVSTILLLLPLLIP